jgi:Luciferase-like monooxygenase
MTTTDPVGAARERLGPVGVWLLRTAGADEERDAARRTETVGYGSLWINQRIGGKEAFTESAILLAATSTIVVGIGIANVWTCGRGQEYCRLPAGASTWAWFPHPPIPPHHAMWLGPQGHGTASTGAGRGLTTEAVAGLPGGPGRRDAGVEPARQAGMPQVRPASGDVSLVGAITVTDLLEVSGERCLIGR